ncbi:MAG: NAD kinase [Bacteroidales bacterium]|nr:MAG: NAD kinase [Bacteroidales bacterium]
MSEDCKPKALDKVVIAIYGKYLEAPYKNDLVVLIDILKKRQVEVVVYAPFYEYLISEFNITIAARAVYRKSSEVKHLANFMLSLGGDGTFLESVAFVEESCIPVLGINFGRLGFLANISTEDIDDAIDMLLNGKFSVEKRSLLQVVTDKNPFADFPYGLNDFTLQKKGTSMITVNAFIDEEFLCTYWADGLIVATPTGSTAYSLSVGGPILSPLSSSLLISAIAPHNLTVRPFVIPDSCTLRLEVTGRSDEVLVSIDSHSFTIDLPLCLEVRKAPFYIGLVNLHGANFYKTLRNKLLWGADKRN